MVGITVARLQEAPMQRRHSGPAAPKLLQSPQQDAAARDAHSVQGGQPAVQIGGSITLPSADEDETETGAGNIFARCDSPHRLGVTFVMQKPAYCRGGISFHSCWKFCILKGLTLGTC